MMERPREFPKNFHFNSSVPASGHSASLAPKVVYRFAKQKCPDDPRQDLFLKNEPNRHSYHGGFDGIVDERDSLAPLQNYNNHMRQRMASFNSSFNSSTNSSTNSTTNLTPSIDIRFRNALRAQTSLENREIGKLGNRCAKKRHSIANLSSGGLSCLPEMKSTSLRGEQQSNIDHTMQQGADINSESPRAGSLASLASINSSASNEKHQPATQQMHATPTVMGPGGAPLEGRILVDPSTGQHYIVPAQPAAPGGMFYPQPMYYQPNHYAYFSPQIAGYGQPSPYAQPFAQSTQSARYPPHATPPQFRHPPFTPMTSHGSSEDLRRAPGDHSTTDRYGDHPPPSPSLHHSKQHQITPFAFPAQYGNPASHRVSPPQPDDPGDPAFRRDSTRLSNEFTHQYPSSEYAFQRSGGQGSGTSLEKFHANSQQQQQQQQQNWWSPRNQMQKKELFEAQTDVEGSPKRNIQMGTASDNEGARRAQQQERAPKAVRMDFDFTKTMPEEEEMTKKEKQMKKSGEEKTSTAFTVVFDAEPRSESLSLQDAARKSGTGRRLLSRRAQMNEQSEKIEKIERKAEMLTQADDSSKHYLLNKLLQGPLSSSSSPLSPEDTPQIGVRKDNDAVSEAGTFVIGAGESKAAAMMRARIVGGSSSDSDSDQSTSSDQDEPVPQRSNSPRRTATGVEGRQEDSSQLLKELIALKRAQARPSTSAIPMASHSSTPTPTPTLASPISPTHRPSRPSAPISSSTSTANRRGDGGRFSMRTQQASPQTIKKPPFRTGLPASNRPPPPPNPQIVAQREQEMTAWLRRKDYNPMKAVQEAKKAQQQKQRADTFISNRSISFHVGAGKQPVKRTSSPGLSRNRSDESLAYEGASTTSASQKVIAEYSRGVVKDINKLTERSRKGDGKELSGLARAVDLLSNKCKKSIELIRSQNKGCLSISLEDLLATAVEPPRESEDLSEQLERLSEAFDAVQRYLEQYSLDGRESPLAEEDEQPETSSLVSGFSSMGLRGKPKISTNVSTGSLAGGRESGQNSRPLRTTAYRSKILAQQRDSSQTRLGKNN
ncbi:unnamed protein product, partial [Mesorhabditis belari]|uniref:Uncharacterized protein n=1 Tax=Mesorhabditis belari TaxID=2138241 RepID=A0AAF3F396_9BILA